MISCFRECRSLWNLVGRQSRGRFKPAAEVEKGNQSGELPDGLLVPAGAPQQFHVPAVHEAGRLCKLAGVPEQGPGLRVQLVLGPCGREFMTQMFIASQAANRRRVEAQSRCTTHLAIHHRGQHLALEPAER